MSITKGIYLGNGLTSLDVCGFAQSEEANMKLLYVPSLEIGAGLKFIEEGKEAGFTQFLVGISVEKGFAGMYAQDAYYKQIIRAYAKHPDVIGFYLDEPYAVCNLQEEHLVYVRNCIFDATDYDFRKKFIIGDIREILKKDYKKIPGVFYAYTSYTDTMFFFGKPLPFGLPNQSRALRRLKKKVGSNLFLVWMYGQNKILCHPDEYGSLFKTARELNIPYAMIYFGDTSGEAYKYNGVTKAQAYINLSRFCREETPFTTLQWFGRFFSRVWFMVKNKIKNGRFE